MTIIGPDGSLIGYKGTDSCPLDPWVGETLRYSVFFGSILLHYLVLHPLWRNGWTDFTMTEKSLKSWDRPGFIRQVSLCCQSTMLHAVLGPVSIYYAYTWASTTTVEQGVVLFSGITAESCPMWTVGVNIGSIFGGWSMFQCVWLVMGWEVGGAAMWVHHIMFAGLSFGCPYLSVLPELTIFAISMEMSTPFLEPMLMLRSVHGYEKQVDVVQALFAVVFIFVRVFFYGYGLFRSLTFWWVAPEAALLAVEDRKTVTITLQVCDCSLFGCLILSFLQVIFTLGYIMQLLWARTIVNKSLKTLCGPKKGQEKSE